MAIYVFKYDEDAQHGFAGWIPTFIRGANAMEGLGVAHDIMEHTLREEGTVEDELMALGSSHYIRGENGYFFDTGSLLPAENQLGMALFSMLQTLLDRFRPLEDPGRMRKVEDSTEKAIQASVRICLELVDRERDSGREEFQEIYELHSRPELARLLAGWVRKGYLRASRIYRNHCSWDVKETFKRLAELVAKMSRQAEIGDTLRVSFSPASLIIRVQHIPGNTRNGAYA